MHFYQKIYILLYIIVFGTKEKNSLVIWRQRENVNFSGMARIIITDGVRVLR